MTMNTVPSASDENSGHFYCQGDEIMTNAEMLKLAVSKDFEKYDNLKLLLETLKVYGDKDKYSIKAAKTGYFAAMRMTNRSATDDIQKSLAAYTLARYFALYAASDDLDMYMIACEWNRTSAAKFWLPRRSVLEGKHGLISRIQKFIDDPNKSFIGISLPPGTGKTTLIKFLLAYIAGKYPQSANMYISYSDGMVKMMYDSLRSILTDTTEYAHNDIFANGMPTVSAEYATLSYRKKGDFPTLGITSLGGSITGRTRANKFLITDDLVKNAEVARNKQRLDTLYEDYTSTVTTRCIGDNIKQIMLGTIWSVHDPLTRMRKEHENDDSYEFIRIPVWDKHHHSNFEYDHPDRYTKKKIEEIKSNIDELTFSCMYLQQPIERKGLLFHESDMNWYDGELPSCEPARKVAQCDVAWGGGDYLSMIFAYVYDDNSVYIHDVVFSQKDKTYTQPQIIAKTQRYKPDSENFEANNGGTEYADDIDRRLRELGIHIRITSKRAPTTQSKQSRIIQYSTDIMKFYFRNDKNRGEEYDEFIAQLLSYNQNSKKQHDDAPDSLAQLCDYIFNGTASVKIIQRFW